MRKPFYLADNQKLPFRFEDMHTGEPVKVSKRKVRSSDQRIATVEETSDGGFCLVPTGKKLGTVSLLGVRVKVVKGEAILLRFKKGV